MRFNEKHVSTIFAQSPVNSFSTGVRFSTEKQLELIERVAERFSRERNAFQHRSAKAPKPKKRLHQQPLFSKTFSKKLILQSKVGFYFVIVIPVDLRLSGMCASGDQYVPEWETGQIAV
jgi:hypothetical protein